MLFCIFLLTVLGVQFFLFQHKHMRWLTKLMSKTTPTRFLNNCAFCQCFWIGLLVAYFVMDISTVKEVVSLGFCSAIFGLVFVAITTPIIGYYEEMHK